MRTEVELAPSSISSPQLWALQVSFSFAYTTLRPSPIFAFNRVLIREWLEDEDGSGAGTVFYFFAVVMGVTGVIFLRVYNTETVAHVRVQPSPDM